MAIFDAFPDETSDRFQQLRKEAEFGLWCDAVVLEYILLTGCRVLAPEQDIICYLTGHFQSDVTPNKAAILLTQYLKTPVDKKPIRWG